MRSWTIAVLVLTLGGVVQAQSPAFVADDIKRLTGHYKPVSVQFDGSEQLPQDPRSRNALTLVIENGEYRAYFQPDPKKDSHFRLFTADLTVNPTARTFDLVIKDGQKKGERRHGIYEHAGSHLKVCYGPADKPRPTSFAAPKGSDCFSETWAIEKR